MRMRGGQMVRPWNALAQPSDFNQRRRRIGGGVSGADRVITSAQESIFTGPQKGR
jgi:hypothetical protein